MNPLSQQTDFSFLPLLFHAQISIPLLNPLVFIIFILTCSIALRYLHIVIFGQERATIWDWILFPLQQHHSIEAMMEQNQKDVAED